MIEKTKKELAASYFLDGYSCTQAIVLAFKDLINIDENTLLKISSPFGGGIGRLRETCGAFTGIIMVLGYLYGNPNNNQIDKSKTYARVQELAKEFKEVNGFIRCRDLLGEKVDTSPNASKRDKNYYLSRPCKNIIANAAEILDKYIKNNK